jgi:hypothetical protein
MLEAASIVSQLALIELFNPDLAAKKLDRSAFPMPFRATSHLLVSDTRHPRTLGVN